MVYTRQLTAISLLGFAVLAGCGEENGSSTWQGETPYRVAQDHENQGNHGARECGNGVVNGKEDCDDGNNDDGDGCSATCAIETGYACTGKKPSVCVTVCGDGIVIGGEACDDGNASAGDGCDATCQIVPGYACIGMPSVCTSGCSNGTVAGSEGCDDANAKDGDGCTGHCQIEPGFICSGTKSLCCIPEVEPNDDAVSASGPLPADVFACGSIPWTGWFGDADYFSFTLPTAGSVVISTYNGAGNPLTGRRSN